MAWWGRRCFDLAIGTPGEAPDQLPYAQGPAGRAIRNWNQ